MAGLIALTSTHLDELPINRPNPIMHAMLYKELGGYATQDKKHIGIVLLDKFDKDYSYVVLKVVNDKTTEAVDMKVSIKTVEEASEELRQKLTKLDGAKGE